MRRSDCFQFAIVLFTILTFNVSCSKNDKQTADGGRQSDDVQPSVNDEEKPNDQPGKTGATAKSKLLPAGHGPTEKDYPNLHNLMQLTGQFYSGGQPDGEAAFAELKRLGIKTVVNVDGAAPNVELAKKYGLNYVHIPIGYDGLPDDAGKTLARLAREADGPVYIHCHHGKHRGPAAAAVACVAAGATDSKGAVSILERAGTSKNYAGLWRDVERYQPPGKNVKLPPLVEVAKVRDLVAAMAKIDRGWDRLKLCRDAKWSVPKDHPDVVPANEALLMAETFGQAAAQLSGDYDEKFKAALESSQAASLRLEEALRANMPEVAEAHFAELEKSCKSCHEKHRD